MATRQMPDLNCHATNEDKADAKNAWVRYLSLANLTAE